MLWTYVNAAFEIAAACAAWVSVARLRRSGRAQGVFYGQVALSGVWGLVAIPYYLSHGDHLSLVGACARDTATATWLVLAWTYDRVRRVQSSGPGCGPVL